MLRNAYTISGSGSAKYLSSPTPKRNRAISIRLLNSSHRDTARSILRIPVDLVSFCITVFPKGLLDSLPVQIG